MSLALQSLVIGLLVLASAVSVFRRMAPRAAWQAQARLSFALERPGRPAWLRRFGLALRPPMQATASACGTGGCNACNGCK